MASMEMFQDSLLEGLRDDWTVMQEDDWPNCNQGMSVLVKVTDPLVPIFFLVYPRSDRFVQEMVCVAQ